MIAKQSAKFSLPGLASSEIFGIIINWRPWRQPKFYYLALLFQEKIGMMNKKLFFKRRWIMEAIIGWVKNWFFVNLANMITTARLIFSACLIVLAISTEQIGLMLILVVLCGITDTADGWVARRYKIESQIGGFLDRLADKIFICPTIVILVWRFWPLAETGPITKLLTEGLVVVVVLLEVVLIVSGLFALIKGLDTSSNRWGKTKMVCQSTAVFVWFFSLTIESYLRIKVLYLSVFLIDAFLIAAIGLAVKSIKEYWQRYQKIDQDQEKKEEKKNGKITRIRQ